jgi:hypothetical protein
MSDSEWGRIESLIPNHFENLKSPLYGVFLIFNCLEGMSDSNVRQICEAELERQ